MFGLRHLLLRHSILAALILAVTASLFTPSVTVAEDEQPLIDILTSDAPKADKAITCKKLAIWGSAKAVPALAELLPDAELSSWARIALEAIPDPAADAALRDAMGKVEGLRLVGVINSIGVRKDAQAVDGLSERIKDQDAQIASAAAVALGRIGDEAARQTLQAALADAPESVRSAVAEGCILCAEKLMADGQADESAAVYDAVRGAEVPAQRIVEATRGAILARGAAGIPLLIEQLKSSDKAMVSIGLMAARELSGPGVSQKLVVALADVAPDLQASLILAMADRGDADVMPAMIDAAKSGPVAVRLAAIEVLKSVGDASCVVALLGVAADDDEAVANAAKETLKALPGDGVNGDLVERLATAKGQDRVTLIELVGMRRIDAVEPLLKAVDDSDASVRNAALLALGEVAKLENVSVLIGRVIKPSETDDAAVVKKALIAACVRMPDREACAEKLAAALMEASADGKGTILGTLARMGGENALKTVGAAANADDAELQDTATRLLGDWMTVDAGPVLLGLAKQPEHRYKIRALRGYLRIVRQFLMSDQQRAAMCRSAWEVVERDSERELLVDAIERYPSIHMLRVAVDVANDPASKEKGKNVAIAVAKKLSAQGDVEELLELVKQKPVTIEIVKATYGAGDKQKDVTNVLKKLVSSFPFITLPDGNYNAAFGGDPAPSVVKKLTVIYKLDGKDGEAVFSENARILLPSPK